jgi:hypothetical protein
MRPITVDQLSRMRSAVSDNFTSLADIVRPSAVLNMRGGATIAATTIAQGVKCRIVESGSPSERRSGEQTKAFMGYVVYFPAGTNVQPKDHIASGSLTLEVIDAIDVPSTQLAIAVYAVRVRA